MPINFHAPGAASTAAAATHGRPVADDDPAALDAFTQFLLAAANAQDAAIPAETELPRDDQAAVDPAAAPPILALPLPSPLDAGRPANPVTIVAAERPAAGKAATATTGAVGAAAASPPLFGIAPPASVPVDGAAVPPALLHPVPGPDVPMGGADVPAPLPPASAAPDRPALDEPVFKPASLAMPGALAGTPEPDKATAAKPRVDAAALVGPLQALHGAPAHAPVHVETIAAPAFTPGWQDETVNKLAQIVLTRHERAELKLNPAELGPVHIRLEMQADQASVTIVAASPETRSALEQSLPQLRDLLASQGITLGQASVRDGAAQQNPFASPWSANLSGGRGGDASAQPGDVVQVVARRSDRMVDVFA